MDERQTRDLLSGLRGRVLELLDQVSELEVAPAEAHLAEIEAHLKHGCSKHGYTARESDQAVRARLDVERIRAGQEERRLREARRWAAAAGEPATPATELVLVACSRTKLARRAPARDLYQGNLFKLCRRWCEARGAEWAILSARCGLVHPGREVEPYDVSLSDLDVATREVWAGAIADAVERSWPGRRMQILAGALYAAPLARVFEARGIEHELTFNLWREEAAREHPGRRWGIGAIKQRVALEVGRTAPVDGDGASDDPTQLAYDKLNQAARALASAEGWDVGDRDLVADAEDGNPRAKLWVRHAEVVLEAARGVG